MAFEVYRAQYGPQSTQWWRNVTTNQPIFDNIDPNKYAEYNGYKIYNSALLVYNNELYMILLFNSSDILNSYIRDNTSPWRTASYNLLNNNVYIKSDGLSMSGTIIYDTMPTFVSMKSSNIPLFSDPVEYMNYISTPPAPPYDWKSFSAVTGKTGITRFTMLKDELLTGDTIGSLSESDFTQFSSGSDMANLIANIPDGEEVISFYAGPWDHLSIERTDLTLYSIKIYVSGNTTPAYTRTWTRAAHGYICFMIDYENEVAKMAIAYQAAGGTWVYNVGNHTDAEMTSLYLFLFAHGEVTPDDVTEQEEDGDGQLIHDYTITGLTKPGTSAILTGFTSLYEVPLGNLRELAEFLWSDNFVDNISKFFNDPREIIIGLSMFPIAPDTDTAHNIRAGGIDTGVPGKPLSDQYKILEDFGTLVIPESKSRKFLNYPPYTKITAHLPFVGEHSLDVNDVMGHTLTLSYIFDFLSGACVAQISKDGKPRYFFGGSCSVQIPTSSEDFGRMYSSILSAGATLGSALATIASGGLTAPLAIGTGVNMISNGMNMTPNVQFSSGSGSINGFISSQTAFVVIERPKEKTAEGQPEFTGRTSLIKSLLSDCHGFTKCLSVHLDNIPCLESEREAIESKLTAGVRIETGSALPEYELTDTTTTVIIFLKNLSDTNVIGKTWSITDYKVVEGKKLYDKSILAPSYILKTDVTDYNYCYIPYFKRFYYITTNVIKANGVSEINLSCDELQSWKTQILNNGAVLERQESIYSTYMSDSELWLRQDKEISVVPFLDEHGDECYFDRENNKYILTIAGGEPTT